MSTAPATLPNDRLVYMLFIATLLHGVLIMGISFHRSGADYSVRPLEVVLVGQGMGEPTERARYIAERSQRGEGGGLDAPDSAGGTPSTGDPIDNAGTLDGRALDQAEPGEAQRQDDLISSPNTSSRRVAALDATVQPGALMLEARLMRAAASSNIVASDQGSLHQDGPRERTVSVDTQEALFAGYLAAWKQRVELLGTLNYPDAARRAGLTGNPVLEVAIGADGGLREIVVVRSSQQKLLDQAALRILRLAAPFEPFPEEIRRQYDVLRFVYEWRFIGQSEAPAP
jgi:periplasmic protein TonB